jgi:hypothetical protein
MKTDKMDELVERLRQHTVATVTDLRERAKRLREIDRAAEDTKRVFATLPEKKRLLN